MRTTRARTKNIPPEDDPPRNGPQGPEIEVRYSSGRTVRVRGWRAAAEETGYRHESLRVSLCMAGGSIVRQLPDFVERRIDPNVRITRLG